MDIHKIPFGPHSVGYTILVLQGRKAAICFVCLGWQNDQGRVCEQDISFKMYDWQLQLQYLTGLFFQNISNRIPLDLGKDLTPQRESTVQSDKPPGPTEVGPGTYSTYDKDTCTDLRNNVSDHFSFVGFTSCCEDSGCWEEGDWREGDWQAGSHRGGSCQKGGIRKVGLRLGECKAGCKSILALINSVVFWITKQGNDHLFFNSKTVWNLGYVDCTNQHWKSQ